MTLLKSLGLQGLECQWTILKEYLGQVHVLEMLGENQDRTRLRDGNVWDKENISQICARAHMRDGEGQNYENEKL